MAFVDDQRPLPVHGGDTLTFRMRYGTDPLDFSANVNPLGTSLAAIQALQETAPASAPYPDPTCRELREVLSRHTRISAEHIICASGASDLIWRLALAVPAGQALVCAPTFSEYEQALNACGWQVQHFALRREEGFALSEGILEVIQPSLGVLFLCEPNNPTGLCSPRELLVRVLDRCEHTGTLLVVDECFCGFLDHPERASLQNLIEDHPQLMILNAFTKLYGMAGARLGYALCSDAALLKRMRESGPSWPVSSLAQSAGCAALEDQAFIERTRALVRSERPCLAAGLSALGCKVYPGVANYLFFEAPCENLAVLLAQRGIMVRDCANYRGLRRGDIRICVRAATDNLVLLRTMGEVLQAAQALRGAHPSIGVDAYEAFKALQLHHRAADYSREEA